MYAYDKNFMTFIFGPYCIFCDAVHHNTTLS